MIQISDGIVILRDFKESDIEKRIYWDTVETEWQLWDAPWEYENLSKEQKKKDLDEYIATMHTRVEEFASKPEDEKRTGFQIDVQEEGGKYIGWCNSYIIDEDCNIAEEGKRCAIGICIPEISVRRKGYAYGAMRLFIDYLLKHGETDIYTQTWSGNMRMLGLADKLGFEEYRRKPKIRTVRGEKYDGLTFRLNYRKYQE